IGFGSVTGVQACALPLGGAAPDEPRAAARLDPARFAPFPLNKYVPQRILGAGGFGVAFLCRHKYMNADVVVKTLAGDDLDRGVRSEERRVGKEWRCRGEG